MGRRAGTGCAFYARVCVYVRLLEGLGGEWFEGVGVGANEILMKTIWTTTIIHAVKSLIPLLLVCAPPPVCKRRRRGGAAGRAGLAGRGGEHGGRMARANDRTPPHPTLAPAVYATPLLTRVPACRPPRRRRGKYQFPPASEEGVRIRAAKMGVHQSAAESARPWAGVRDRGGGVFSRGPWVSFHYAIIYLIITHSRTPLLHI